MTGTITLPRSEAKKLLRALRVFDAGAMIKAEEMLIAALAQQAEQGWVWVPVEPTQSMLRALINEWDSVGGKSMYENYKAMLAAAPKGWV